MNFRRFPTQLEQLGKIQSLSWMADGSFAYTYTAPGNRFLTLGSMSPDGTESIDLTTHVDSDIAASPIDSNQIAFIPAWQVGIYSIRQRTATCYPLIAGNDQDQGMIAWSPDGKYVAFSGFRKSTADLKKRISQLAIFDQQMQTIKVIESDDYMSQLSWRADSRQLAYWVVGDGLTKFVGIDEPDAPELPQIVDYRFSPAGNGVTYIKKENEFQSSLVAAFDGRSPRILAKYDWLKKQLNHEWLSISPNGRLVILNGGPFHTHVLRLYSLEHDKIVALEYEDDEVSFASPTWSPDSSEIAFVTNRGQIQILKVA